MPGRGIVLPAMSCNTRSLVLGMQIAVQEAMVLSLRATLRWSSGVRGLGQYCGLLLQVGMKSVICMSCCWWLRELNVVSLIINASLCVTSEGACMDKGLLLLKA